jgi:hypothetical protein
MAQTRRKRRTKHRGNAAGMVEVRGRTGRAPTPQDRKAAARQARTNRYDRPPSWRSSVNRALFAVVLFMAVVLLAFGQKPVPAIMLGAVMLLIYVPLGYYTDLHLYRRRQAKKLEAQRRAREERR